MAATKVFWDTNILLDFIDRRPHELAAVDGVFLLHLQGLLHVYVSESVVTNTLYLSKTLQPHVAITELLLTATALATNNQILQQALASSFKDKEDAILYHLALHHGMEAFITRDKRDFGNHASPLLPLMSPDEFMQAWRDTAG
jgi:predicted nucleic acid-binding protein